MSDAQERIWVFIATLETTNFNFRSIGRTEDEAIEAMHSALVKHGEQYGCAASWWNEFGEVSISRLAFGVGTRDGDIFCDLAGRLDSSDTVITYREVGDRSVKRSVKLYDAGHGRRVTVPEA